MTAALSPPTVPVKRSPMLPSTIGLMAPLPILRTAHIPTAPCLLLSSGDGGSPVDFLLRHQCPDDALHSVGQLLVAVRKRGILALRRGLVWCTADPHRFLPHCHHPIGPSGRPPDTSYRPAHGVQDRAPSVLNVSRLSPTPASRPLIHSSATTATQFQCPWVRSHDRRPGPARRGKITPRTLAENSSRIRDGQALVASGKHRSPNTTVTRHVLHHQGGRIRHLMPRPRLEIYRTASMGNTLIQPDHHSRTASQSQYPALFDNRRQPALRRPPCDV